MGKPLFALTLTSRAGNELHPRHVSIFQTVLAPLDERSSFQQRQSRHDYGAADPLTIPTNT
jgi:hypothetical protein